MARLLALGPDGNLTEVSAETQWVINVPTDLSIGYSTAKHISKATTNARCVKAGPGQVYGFVLCNTNASLWRYFKLYDKASAPIVGNDTPLMTIGIPPSSSVQQTFEHGVIFSLGIASAVTGGIADNNTTAIRANEVIVNLFYK